MTVDERQSGHESPPDASPSLLPLTKMIVYKNLLLTVRYPLNFLAALVSILLVFGLVFFGGEAAMGSQFEDSQDGFIVGFFLFTFAFLAYAELAWSITREAQWGTLERLAASPHGLGTFVVIKTFIALLMQFFWAAAMLVVMMLVTGRWLSAEPVTVILLSGLTIGSVVGIGFFFAGLALLYKRIENIFNLVQFALVPLIAAPVGSVPWLKFLPVTYGSYLTRVALTENVRIWEFAPSKFAFLVGITASYLILGYYFFYRASLRARKQGVLGHY